MRFKIGDRFQHPYLGRVEIVGIPESRHYDWIIKHERGIKTSVWGDSHHAKISEAMLIDRGVVSIQLAPAGASDKKEGV